MTEGSACDTNVVAALLRFLDLQLDGCCVVGDTRLLPRFVDGDIDIVVPASSLSTVPILLSRFCQRHGGTVVQILRHEQSAEYYVLCFQGCEDGPFYVRVDFCTDFLRKGRLFLTFRELLEGRRRAKSQEGEALPFHEPAPPKSLIYYILKKVDKGELNDRHASFLSAKWRENRQGAESEIRRFWDADETQLIVSAAERGDWTLARRDIGRLRASLRRRLRSSWRLRVRELVRKASRVIRPTGAWVVLLGPDGSGKTAVATRVVEGLAPAFRRTKVVHFQPRRRAAASAVPPVTEPHKNQPRGLAGSSAKLAFLFLAYVSGYWLEIRPKLVRSTLVVFDRYYHDLLVDPRRYRHGGPMLLARLVGVFVPKPDLWIVLDAPAEVLQSRKQEVTFEESRRQKQAYLCLAGRFPNAAIIDASKPLDEVVAATGAAILDYMAKRTARRLGLAEFNSSEEA